MGLIKCHSPRQSASCPQHRHACVLRCVPLLNGCWGTGTVVGSMGGHVQRHGRGVREAVMACVHVHTYVSGGTQVQCRSSSGARHRSAEQGSSAGVRQREEPRASGGSRSHPGQVQVALEQPAPCTLDQCRLLTLQTSPGLLEMQRDSLPQSPAASMLVNDCN